MKMMKLWRRLITSVVLCGAIGISLVTVGCSVQTTRSTAMASYGLQVLSSGTDMAVSGICGNEVVFSADLFARNLNLSQVDSVKVCSLPADTEGELLLGSTRVAVGQTISESNLGHLVFAAATEDVRHASFTFTANGGATPMLCNIYLLSENNYAPTLSMVPELSLNVFTYKDLEAYGTLSAYDPDGDELTFEIVSYPQYGAIDLADPKSGIYVYTPQSGYIGTDSFSYVARDLYGNYSACAKVSLRVNPVGTSVVYADLSESKAYNAALALTEAGIMSGSQVGNRFYFYPEQTVSRAEFLVMAMHAAGITDVPDCTTTAFYDDASIPDSMKGYVAAAYSLGYISGTNVMGNLCFLPNEDITRAQAAVIVANIIGTTDVAVVPTFSDHGEIPVWASDAVYSLYSVGILTASDGRISATAKLTREQTAMMLCAVRMYRN